MAKYLLRKLLLTLPLLWGVVTLIFLLVELSPGDIADKYFTPESTPEVRAMIAAKYGLDQPMFVRYLVMLRNLMLFDFGISMVSEKPVFDEIMERIPATLLLSFVTLLFAYPTGIALGILQAARRGRPEDTGLGLVSLTFYSMPSFWLAIVLQLVFTYWWPLLPTSGRNSTMLEYSNPSIWEVWWDTALHLILPGAALGVASAAGVARYMRSSMLEVIHQDYIRTARAKGLSEWRVFLKHGLRNALLPIITLFGLSLPVLFSGSVLIENIFAWPGMGRLIVEAIFAQNTPMIVACFFVFSLVVVAGNLLADVLYAVADPRIRLE